MNCIYCNKNTKVINSRHQKRPNNVWRRRHCKNCKSTFTSVESPKLDTSLLFIKKNEAPEPFLRDKLLVSIYKCLLHRKTAQTDATALTDTVISKVHSNSNKVAINRDLVVNIVIDTLSKFDKPSAVQYTAYHPVARN